MVNKLHEKEMPVVYSAALRLLGRREYCRAQLYTKLERKCSAETLVNVLDRLQREGSLSDRRFSECYVRQRFMQGFGPVKISYQLVQKGVDPGVARSVIYSGDWQWDALVVKVASKRWQSFFPETDFFSETGLEEKGQDEQALAGHQNGDLIGSVMLSIKRYLKQRGFTFEQIATASKLLQQEQV